MAINIVSGCGDGNGNGQGGFAVDDCATRDPEAARERFDADFFIMDVQTHHADLDGPVGTNPGLQAFFKAFRICQPGVTKPDCHPGEIGELSRANYLKEIFLDSETAIAIMSGSPHRRRRCSSSVTPRWRRRATSATSSAPRSACSRRAC